MSKRATVTGAGGFIGGHLIKDLLEKGYEVKAFDKKPRSEWYQIFKKAKNFHGKKGDLIFEKVCDETVKDVDIVYNLAEDMGGIGYCENNHLLTGLSGKIHVNLIESVLKLEKKPHIFYSSSACVYNEHLQSGEGDVFLKESDAWPASPDLLYGLNKLYCERMYHYLHKEFKVPVSIVRFHNAYGPFGTYDGGREKAPAAAIRKMVELKLGKSKEVKIWGDGKQKRSFMFIDDVIEGIHKIVDSGYREPINLGSAEGVTIQKLHDIAAKSIKLNSQDIHYKYDESAPQGVRSRNSDNTIIKEITGWEPTFPLAKGMAKTAKWIEKKMLKNAKA